MASGMTTNELVRGMGAGARLLELLEKGVREVGGDPDKLVFLTRPRFAAELKKVAQTIAECDCRIPASEMRKRAERWSRQNFEVLEAYSIEARNLWWRGVLRELRIPFEDYGRAGERKIPYVFLKQLDGREISYPLFLSTELKKNDKVVVEMHMHQDKQILNPGVIIKTEEIESLSVADTKYFDFDK